MPMAAYGWLRLSVCKSMSIAALGKWMGIQDVFCLRAGKGGIFMQVISGMRPAFVSWPGYRNGSAGRSAGAAFPGMEMSGKPSAGSSASERTQEIRQMLRELERSTEEKENSLFGVTSGGNGMGAKTQQTNTRDKKTGLHTKYRYNYKDVSGKILRAKNSVSAGLAVIAAKRKVVEVKRKLLAEDGDSDELQLALTHAQRMEMAARKKKHHLEQEEMVKAVQERDAERERQNEAAHSMAEAAQEQIAEREDAVFEERGKLADALSEQRRQMSAANTEMRMPEMTGPAAGASGAMLAETAGADAGGQMEELNQMLAGFGEEMLRELEEAMEQFENMEILDPHMSEEELEEVKRKHRIAEQKMILKADMDYLKGSIRHTLAKGAGIPGMGSGTASPAAVGMQAPAGEAAAPPAVAIDVQL